MVNFQFFLLIFFLVYFFSFSFVLFLTFFPSHLTPLPKLSSSLLLLTYFLFSCIFFLMDPLTPLATKYIYSSFNIFTTTEGFVQRLASSSTQYTNESIRKRIQEVILQQNKSFYNGLLSYLAEVEALATKETIPERKERLECQANKLGNQAIIWSFLHAFAFDNGRPVPLQFLHAMNVSLFFLLF